MTDGKEQNPTQVLVNQLTFLNIYIKNVLS